MYGSTCYSLQETNHKNKTYHFTKKRKSKVQELLFNLKFSRTTVFNLTLIQVS